MLPWSQVSAAENMARDWLLLEAFPQPEAPRWRAYGWTQPSWTFGYSRHWAAAFAASSNQDTIRRPTGGGLVDHRADWTYAIALPAAHPLARARAPISYRAVHEALAQALRAAGAPAQLADAAPSSRTSDSSLCFAQPEPGDVIRADNGRKIAGAAQKRARSGLLFQGSVAREAAAEIGDWDFLAARFTENLGELLRAQPYAWTADPFSPSALATATARFASPAWNQRR
jgi:lipoyl(octanoyl) transferase